MISGLSHWALKGFCSLNMINSIVKINKCNQNGLFIHLMEVKSGLSCLHGPAPSCRVKRKHGDAIQVHLRHRAAALVLFLLGFSKGLNSGHYAVLLYPRSFQLLQDSKHDKICNHLNCSVMLSWIQKENLSQAKKACIFLLSLHILRCSSPRFSLIGKFFTKCLCRGRESHKAVCIYCPFSE